MPDDGTEVSRLTRAKRKHSASKARPLSSTRPLPIVNLDLVRQRGPIWAATNDCTNPYCDHHGHRAKLTAKRSGPPPTSPPVNQPLLRVKRVRKGFFVADKVDAPSPAATVLPPQEQAPATAAHLTAPQFLLRRANENASNDGHDRALAILQGRGVRDVEQTRVPLTLNDHEAEQLKRPSTCVPFFSSPDPETLNALEEAETDFALALGNKEDREAFKSGRRLTCERREILLQRLTDEQRAECGLRFSAEPSPFNDPPDVAERRAQPSIAAHVNLPPNARHLLMFLWHFADPLLLDLTVDAWREGVNVGYNGEFTSTSAKNMVKSAVEQREAADLVITEILKGHAVGFYTEPQFEHIRTIPFGFVPKKDGTSRPIDNFSSGGNLSVNALSDEMKRDSPPFNKAVLNLHKAGTEGFLVGWDVAHAYNTNTVRLHDQWLTVTRLPVSALAHRPDLLVDLSWPDSCPPTQRFVYCHRIACPFGLRASGYRWDTTGRAMISMYEVMQHRLHVTLPSCKVALLPAKSFLLEHARATSVPDPLWASDPCTVLNQGDDSLLCNLGRERLRALQVQHPDANISLSGVARNTDDFLVGFPDEDSASRAAAAVIWLHAVVNVKLKKHKFTHVTKATDFHGFDMIVPRTIRYQPEKCERLAERAEVIAQGHPSILDVQTAVGTAMYLATMYPQLRGSMSPLFQLLSDHARHVAFKSRKARARKKITAGPEARHTATVLRDIALHCPSSTSTIVRADSPVSRATIVVHTDYASSTRHTGFVWLSRGVYRHERVSDEVCEKWGGSIPTMEALAVLHFLQRCGTECEHSILLIFTDSISFLQAYERYFLKKALSGSPGLAQMLIKISERLIQHSLVLHLEFVPSASNLADPVSRLAPSQVLTDSLSSLGYAVPFSLMK